MRKLSAVWMLGLVLLAVPVFAGGRTVTNGIDLWMTPGDGTTFSDFGYQPLPAGFFCDSSEPFSGRIVFKGVPIATGEAGVLGAADTIVQRLDDAAFDKRGVATTRIQMRAMQFESVGLVKTSCGSYKARVTLDGEQPVTTMRIVRDNQKGGRFYAPIHVNIVMTFTPVGRNGGDVVTLKTALRFPPAPNTHWTHLPGDVTFGDYVKVDTDGDGEPDTDLPGTSNFTAGMSSARVKAAACHAAAKGQHCPVVLYEIPQDER